MPRRSMLCSIPLPPCPSWPKMRKLSPHLYVRNPQVQASTLQSTCQSHFNKHTRNRTLFLCVCCRPTHACMEQNALLVCPLQANSCLHETKRSSCVPTAGQLVPAWNKTLFLCVCRRPARACMKPNALLVCLLPANSCLHGTKRSSRVSAAGQLMPAWNKTLFLCVHCRPAHACM